jgi:hypothetical protein
MNDEQMIWESYIKNILNEADTLGRAYRLTRKSVSNKRFTPNEFYNYIKAAQNRAKDILKSSGESKTPVTIFHMINYHRLDRDKDKLMSAANYLLSKKDEEISVSFETQPWDIRDSIILVGVAKDIYEHYKTDTNTAESKERYPKDIRPDDAYDWDEAIVNLRDVKWEYFYDNIHIPEVSKFLKDNDLSEIYSHKELRSHFTSEKQEKQTDIDEEYIKISSELGYKYQLINNFIDFLEGDHVNAEIIRNSDSFINVLRNLNRIDEYNINELLQYSNPNSDYESENVENIIPRDELGYRINEETLNNTKKEINEIIQTQNDLYDAWGDLIDELNNKGDLENSSKIEKSKNLKAVTENGRLFPY